MRDLRDIEPARPASFRLEHQILVLDAGLRASLDCKSCTVITRRFIDDLLNALGMAPLGELGIYPAVDQRAPGWSFIQPITTSHVSAHYFEKPGRVPHIRLDAYSCATFDWMTLIHVCNRHFALGDWRATFIDRQIEPQHERTVVDLAGTGSRLISECVMSANARIDRGEFQCT